SLPRRARMLSGKRRRARNASLTLGSRSPGGATSCRRAASVDSSASVRSSNDSFISFSLGLTGRAETPSHRPPRAHQLTFGSARLDLEHPRDLFMREAFDVVEQEHGPKAIRQIRDRAPDIHRFDV